MINKFFLIRTDSSAPKFIIQNDVKNLVSKQIFARWQALLSCFDFEIEHTKGPSNSLLDFLSREFLQGKVKSNKSEEIKDGYSYQERSK